VGDKPLSEFNDCSIQEKTVPVMQPLWGFLGSWFLQFWADILRLTFEMLSFLKKKKQKKRAAEIYRLDLSVIH
jgi:hypothetical protein